jgi:hypothetical protein
MSRVEDYFETDKSIDAKQVVIHGVSRLGKTVMWAGAHDVWPAASQPVFHDLSYSMHEGGHGMVSSDWSIYAEFLKRALHGGQ